MAKAMNSSTLFVAIIFAIVASINAQEMAPAPAPDAATGAGFSLSTSTAVVGVGMKLVHDGARGIKY